jgi:adhesin transport system outer membrane protein
MVFHRKSLGIILLGLSFPTLVCAADDTPHPSIFNIKNWFSPSNPESDVVQLRASDLVAKMPPQQQPLSTQDRLDASKILTQQEAIRLAVNHHPSISSALATLAQQGSGKDAARAGYYPQISGGVNAGLLNTGYQVKQDPAQVASIKLTQMLYDFGKVSSRVSQAEYFIQKQKAVVIKQIDQISIQTAEAVVATHRYQALVNIAQGQVDATARVTDMARLRAKAGISTMSDPIQAQSRLEASQANLLQVKSQYQQSRERLRTLMGVALEGDVADMPPGLLEAAQLNTPPNIAALPDVLIAEADLGASQALLQSTKADGYPTISLEADYNKALNGLNPTTFVDRGQNSTIGISASTYIYQGGANKAQVKAATYAADAARQQVNVAQLNTYDQVRLYRSQIDGSQGRLDVLSQRKLSIIRTRELYQEQYKLGTRSILDLLNAEQEIYQSEADEESVRHDLWLSLVDYIGAVGLARSAFGLNNTSVQGVEILP